MREYFGGGRDETKKEIYDSLFRYLDDAVFLHDGGSSRRNK